MLKNLALATAIALLIGSAPASAQLKKPALTGNLLNDIQTNAAGGASATGLLSGTSSLTTFLTNLAAFDEAVTLSTSIPGLQDPVGNACWQQFTPVQALIKAHPLPLSFKVASDIEAGRLAMIAMNQVCANPNCGQMFVDATNAAASITGAPVPISLASICSKIPVIGTSAVPTSTASVPLVGTTAAPTKP
jgi:hypothetical protein